MGKSTGDKTSEMSPVGVPESHFERLGGEPVLRGIIDHFVDRVFDDTMIGFFFRNASRQRVKAKEYEHAAVHLGAPGVVYTGRPLEVAHGPHPIMGGHFMRRLQILKEVLGEAEVPPDVVAHWVAHTERLRPLVTAQPGSECIHGEAQPQAPAVGRALPTTSATHDNKGGRHDSN